MTTLGSIGDDEIINIRLNSERPLTIRDDWDDIDTYLWQSISSRTDEARLAATFDIGGRHQ
jgi:hypothetical protein